MMCVSQIMLYTLNIHAVGQLYLSTIGRNKQKLMRKKLFLYIWTSSYFVLNQLLNLFDAK